MLDSFAPTQVLQLKAPPVEACPAEIPLTKAALVPLALVEKWPQTT